MRPQLQGAEEAAPIYSLTARLLECAVRSAGNSDMCQTKTLLGATKECTSLMIQGQTVLSKVYMSELQFLKH